MKRSEALQIIYKCIDRYFDPRGSYDIISAEILEKLLEAGFLPPTIKLEPLGYLDNGWEDEV